MNILIVESKAKCKTLLKHLGKGDWRVLPTGGHIERLPYDPKIHPPKEVKKAYWSNRPGQLPNPPWFWTERGEAAVAAIVSEAKKHGSVVFYLAPDPDREGERIAWHLQKLLSPLGECHRVSFQEITKTAVLAAVGKPQEIDHDLVDAALIRSFIDRMVGWRASNIAKRYTDSYSNSMGRVQTPTLGFIVERELEREAHVPVRYFEVRAATELTDWRVRFHEQSDADAWRDEQGKFSAYRTADSQLSEKAHDAISQAGRLLVNGVKRTQKSQSPKPPFSTDALLQAAGSRWGWSPKKTAALASKLYESGHLTYIRTDSTRLANEAVEAGRVVIEETWGARLLGQIPDTQAGAGAQDAHEAIRPTDLGLDHVPEAEPDAQKLYALVRARTLASLMAPSLRMTLSLKARCAGLEQSLDASVGWYQEPGWRLAFKAPDLDESIETAPLEVEEGTELVLIPATDEQPNPVLIEDQTKPPGRYKAHTLVRKMKEAGIGRPSTYAQTIDRLQERGYVEEESGALAPTQNGRNIWLQAAPLFSLDDDRNAFSTDYTAEMESLLDEVAAGRSPASAVWERMRDEFKAAHAAAQQASQGGPLLPSTRKWLEDYLQAAPQWAAQVGDFDSITEAQGKAWLSKFRGLGIELLATDKQMGFMEKLLDEKDVKLSQLLESDSALFSARSQQLLKQMAESSGQGLATSINDLEIAALADSLSRKTVNGVIDHLLTLPSDDAAPGSKPASPGQIKFIQSLAKKKGLDEAGVCELIGARSYKDLTGGWKGTADQLIQLLKA